MERVHGTALALGDRGVLLRGASGRGKSDLALRCLGLPVGRLVPLEFRLVADDQVTVTTRGGDVWLSCPAPLLDLLEVRGLGIIKVQSIPEVQLRIVVDLVDRGVPARLPEPRMTSIAGIDLPMIEIFPFEVSAPLKVALALQRQL